MKRGIRVGRENSKGRPSIRHSSHRQHPVPATKSHPIVLSRALKSFFANRAMNTQPISRPLNSEPGLLHSGFVILHSSSFPLFQPIRGGCLPLPNSAFRKITKRTHFRIFDLPANKGDYSSSVSNLDQKRTHFSALSVIFVPFCSSSFPRLVATKHREGGSEFRVPATSIPPCQTSTPIGII